MRDDFSRAVTPIILSAESIDIKPSVATGFYWKDGQQWMLITNSHNVTGVNPATNEVKTFYPTKLAHQIVFIESDNGGRAVYRVRTLWVDLFKDGRAIWYEHPSGQEVDCVAIPIEIENNVSLQTAPMNEIPLDHKLLPRAGMNCFVIGYPLGLSGPARSPIWKRGSIASDPTIEPDSAKEFYIDATSNKGMSGSPVLLRHDGYWSPPGSSGSMKDDYFGPLNNIVGIYAGRDGLEDDLDGRLGRVLKIKYVHEIIDAKIRSDRPA